MRFLERESAAALNRDRSANVTELRSHFHRLKLSRLQHRLPSLQVHRFAVNLPRECYKYCRYLTSSPRFATLCPPYPGVFRFPKGWNFRDHVDTHLQLPTFRNVPGFPANRGENAVECLQREFRELIRSCDSFESFLFHVSPIDFSLFSSSLSISRSFSFFFHPIAFDSPLSVVPFERSFILIYYAARWIKASI